jgi:hypothetical protein
VQHPQGPKTTIAILGADTVVRNAALCALLGGHGYRIIPLDSHPTGVVDELLEEADLLLLAPRLEERAREVFLGAVGRSDPRTAGVPVIELRTALEQAPPGERVLSVPWPCETKVLVERIEAALLDAPAAPADPYRATGRG